MALIKNKISIPFAKGIETKTDDKQEQVGNLEQLKNVTFDGVNQLKKRKGYKALSNQLINETSIANPKRLAVFKNELGLITDTNYYAYSESLEKWTDRGSVFTAFPTSSPIVRDAFTKDSIDSKSVEGLNIYTYKDAQGIKISITDSTANNFILSNQLISASGTSPRVEVIQNLIFVMYTVGTDIKYVTINLISPTTVNTEQTLLSDLSATNQHFDVTESAQKLLITYNNTSNQLSLISIDSGEVTSSVTTFPTENPSNCLSITSDEQERVIITYATTTAVKVIIQSPNVLSNILPPTTVETINNVVNCASIQTYTHYETYYEISAVSKKDHFVKHNTVDLSAVVGTPTIVMRSVGIASKPLNYQSRSHISVIHSSQLQSTYYIINSEGKVISKHAFQVAGDLISNNIISKVTNLESGKYLLAYQIKGRTITDDGTFFSALGVSSLELNFEEVSEYQNVALGDNLHLSGGALQQYDGKNIVEHGFSVFPEDLSASTTSTTGGAITDGTRQYSAIYAWTDNYGQIHRSAPSIGLEVISAGGTATQTQDIIVPTLRITEKENVIVELYRTEDAGDIFYKVSSTTVPTFNDKTNDTVTIQDPVSDTDLISKEILYTTGGFLDNIAAPSSRLIESYNDRIFLAGLEDKNKIVFSKIRDEYEAVEFNDTLYKYVSEIGGNVTALKTLDDKLIIFKEDAIFYMSGDGPNDLGEQDTFVEPQRISSEVGCIEPESVVLSPIGLMFKSRKGIYLLSRNLSIGYIGSNVEKFNSDKITSAIIVPEANQVRFTTNNQEALVYNYFANQWATYDNHKALSAISIKNDYFYLRPDSLIYKEDSSNYTDNGSSVNMKVETSWISLNQVQGFQRVYSMLLLGEFKSPHKLRIRVAYNFIDAFTQEVIVDTSDFTDNTKYGEYSPYGNPETVPYGGSGNLHQIRIDLETQKCQSIKFYIEEIQDIEQGEGLVLSNMLLVVGAKKGEFKMSQDNIYGTKSTT